MQNPIQKFTQNSIVFEKPGVLSENLKTLTSSNYPTIQYFLLKLRACFLLTNVYKRLCRIFLDFVQILSYFQKLKRLGFYTLFFYIFINNSRPKLNKNNLKHSFLDFIKQKTCAKFRQQISNSKVVGARQSFQFFKQKNLVSWK